METNKYKGNQLQFLRFCAFLLICVFHTGIYQFLWFPKGNGAANAVEFFVLLGGVVSGISSYGKNVECSISNIFKYMKKKIKKVYPLYFLTTIFTITLSSIPLLIAQHHFADLKPSLIQLTKCLLLIQSWFPKGYFSYNGVGWFLSTMMFLYLINIPLRTIASKICNSKYSKVIFGLIFVGTYTLIWLYCYLTRNTNMEYTQYVLPVSRVGEYVCGMSIGYLIRLFSEKIKRNKVLFLIFTVLEVLSFLFWLKNMYLPMESWHCRIVHWLTPNIILIFIFGLGLGGISEIFRINFLRYLGDISFECFLLHQIIIKLYRNTTELESVSKLGNLFSILFCITFTVLVASLISNRKIKESSHN